MNAIVENPRSNVVILILFKILEENTNENSCLEIKRKKVLHFYRKNMLR